jgi:prepilin-type N-terminal cleavage/methylation domain-containing protein
MFVFDKKITVNTQSGFTLVEMLVVIFLNTILLAVIMSTVTQLYKNNSYSFEQANEIEAARRGVSNWTRDAREMNYGANGAFPVAKLSSTTMGFYSDVDKDTNMEYVEYILSSTTLKKYVYNPVGYPATYSTSTPDSVETLSIYVQNLLQNKSTFRYYDSSGNELSTSSPVLGNLSYATINIIVNIDPVRSPGEFMLQGSAAPRNLKTNL